MSDTTPTTTAELQAILEAEITNLSDTQLVARYEQAVEDRDPLAAWVSRQEIKRRHSTDAANN